MHSLQTYRVPISLLEGNVISNEQAKGKAGREEKSYTPCIVMTAYRRFLLTSAA